MKTHKVRPILVEGRETSVIHLNYGNVLNVSEFPVGSCDEWKSYPKQIFLISLEDEKFEVGDRVACYEDENFTDFVGLSKVEEYYGKNQAWCYNNTNKNQRWN